MPLIAIKINQLGMLVLWMVIKLQNRLLNSAANPVQHQGHKLLYIYPSHIRITSILRYQGRSMADILELLVMKFMFADTSVDDSLLSMQAPQGEPQRHREWHGNLNRLMNHLKTIMLGYENEEALGLLRELEKTARKFCGRVDRILNNLKGRRFQNVETEGSIKRLEMRARQMVWRMHGDRQRDKMLEIIEQLCNIRHGSSVEGEEIVVGFDNEVETLLDQLTQTSIRHVQIISITGMAGLGKTTLARRLYRDPLIEYHFDIRAWICVSQIYVKRDLLLGILSSFVYDLTEEIYEMGDDQLGEKLYRLLKDRKYLVVLDDIWDCMAWNDLKVYFPDDKVGSRVLFTSRDIEVSLHVGASRPAHVLRLRTADESYYIFRRKVFRTGICLSQLRTIGKKIAAKCEGLPLAIVIAAGLVKTELSVSWWSQIARSLRSYLVRDPRQYMDTLSLSYNHLPPHLRSCFLFLGVFPEDSDIPVKKLIWLWIAQGFICQTGSRVLEDVAEDFLVELITRSLLMTAKKRADGQIKACRVHDLLRDLCLRKANEEKLSPETYRYAPVLASSSTTANMLHERSIHGTSSRTLTGLCYPSQLGHVLQVDGSVLIERYESLTVLDMESISISIFPCSVTKLSNLRYLAIQARDGSPQESISNLVNLQMLIILSRKNIVVPNTIWDMVNLRHLYIKAGENLIKEKTGSCSGLGSLQTLSQVSPQSCRNIISNTPNLRKLGFCGPLKSRLGYLEFPDICSLEHLQKLKLLNTTPYPEPTKPCNPLLFPKNLQKLTLSNTGLDWEEMWTCSWLPNLEVLKLRVDACIGEKWETSDDTVFRKLKVLKLHDLKLRQWVCSSKNFPRLQRLIVHGCLNLESIPSGLGKILTLDMIEVSGCSSSAYSSAVEIQKEQEQEGNYFLKVHAIKSVSGTRIDEVADYPKEFHWSKCRKRQHSQDEDV